MPVAPLTPDQATQVAEAARLLESRRPREAAEAVAQIVADGCSHPDPLMIYSMACEQLGMSRDAVGACQAALQASPERADLWAALGRLIHEQGQHDDAVGLLEQSLSIDPANADAWYNLGLAAGAAGHLDRAVEAVQRATELRPAWPMAWGGLGHAQERAGDLDAAEASLRRALVLDPALESARFALVAVLRRLSEADEASKVAERSQLAETRLMAAHALADAAREEAPDRYRSLLRMRPDLIEGHEFFARLMPQLGRIGEAFDTYREGLAAAPSLDLYLSAMRSARDLGETDVLQGWIDEARGRFGALPDFTIFEALVRARQGDSEAALAMLEPLAASGRADVLNHCAYLRLKSGDLDQAEAHALAATRADFTDQLAWACLTIVWRLKEDERERWLADYDRFVMPIMLDPPEGHASIEDFLGALATELHALHNTEQHPADQSLRNGTQTRGHLFDRRSSLIRALAAGVRRQVSERVSQLPQDPTHPFLGRDRGIPKFLGSWSVRLRSGGFHIGHIHNQGWLSSALYVELPEGVGQGKPGEASPGALQFGVPHSDFGIDLPPRRIEQPEVGRLVIFPSYFWHGTLPFDSDAQRLTVAFDMAPA
jgi:tetratricopeptide (TPR) repeat protein